MQQTFLVPVEALIRGRRAADRQGKPSNAVSVQGPAIYSLHHVHFIVLRLCTRDWL